MKPHLEMTLDNFMKDYYRSFGNSGYLRVTLKDDIIYQNSVGFADAENKIPFSEDSVFTIYSISKPFCAIGLLKLAEQNVIDIDTHPGAYVPEAKPFDSALTVRHMLQHISGLPDFVQTAKFGERYFEGLSCHIREHLKELSAYPMVFKPGEGEMYANINYIMCALIIENMTGMSYGEYMQKEIFTPLGMYKAQVDRKGLIVDKRVKGYEIQDGEIVCVERDLNWLFGAGDIIATADDVYCLNKALKHRLLLKDSTWLEILTPSPLNSMGLGCTISSWHGKKRVTHNGGSRGFRTMHIHVLEDDLDIIFLSNSGWGEARADYAEAVYEAFYGKDDIASETVKMDVGYI